MIIRCPECKFTAKITDPRRLTADHQPLCPRCHTLISIPDFKDGSADSVIRHEMQRQESRKVHWERRTSWLDLAAFGRTSLNILFHPSATFAALNYNTGISSSLVFALVYGSLGLLLGRYWFTILGIHYGILEADAMANTVRFAGVALSLPLLLLFFIFFASSLVHVFLRLLFATNRSYSATVQVMAYSSGAATLFNVIPIVGSALVPIWALGIWCIGLAKAHQTSKIRTFFALFLPLILTAFLVVGLILVIVALGVMEFLDTIRLHT